MEQNISEQIMNTSPEKTLYLFPVAAVTNSQKLSGLKPQKFILSPFWRPEVCNQGVSRTTFPLRL